MNCILCETEIVDYNPQFNQLKIDDTHTVDFCLECINKVVRWQKDQFVTLFPTTQGKKWSKKIK